MNRLYVMWATLCCVTLLQADTWNKKTIVSFPEKVEIPGAVLDPGKYVFKLVDSQSNRHIVQVTNDRENRVFVTVLAIPNYRTEPADKTVMTFYEMPGGRPQALRSWFYPGDNFGQEFAYPKTRSVEIARATGLNVPSGSAEPEPQPETASEASAAPAEPPQPQGQNVEPAKSVETAQAAKPDAEAANQKASETMPKTASDLPLFVVIGLGALAAATSLRIGARPVV